MGKKRKNRVEKSVEPECLSNDPKWKPLMSKPKPGKPPHFSGSGWLDVRNEATKPLQKRFCAAIDSLRADLKKSVAKVAKEHDLDETETKRLFDDSLYILVDNARDGEREVEVTFTVKRKFEATSKEELDELVDGFANDLADVDKYELVEVISSHEPIDFPDA